VGPRAGLDAVEKKILNRHRESNPENPNRPVRSQSLCRLNYPGFIFVVM
jgi:hypothetical protein